MFRQVAKHSSYLGYVAAQCIYIPSSCHYHRVRTSRVRIIHTWLSRLCSRVFLFSLIFASFAPRIRTRDLRRVYIYEEIQWVLGFYIETTRSYTRECVFHVVLCAACLVLYSARCVVDGDARWRHLSRFAPCLNVYFALGEVQRPFIHSPLARFSLCLCSAAVVVVVVEVHYVVIRQYFFFFCAFTSRLHAARGFTRAKVDGRVYPVYKHRRDTLSTVNFCTVLFSLNDCLVKYEYSLI